MEKVMKLSSNTLNLLNNFSTINSGITVKTGNEISTVSAMKNIFAKAKDILSPDQFEAFKDAVTTTTDMQKSQLEMAAQMFGN